MPKNQRHLEKQQIALTMRTDAETSRQMPRDKQVNPQDRRNDRGKPQDKRQEQQRDNRPPRPEKPSFNNPFADQLAKFKK